MCTLKHTRKKISSEFCRRTFSLCTSRPRLYLLFNHALNEDLQGSRPLGFKMVFSIFESSASCSYVTIVGLNPTKGEMKISNRFWMHRITMEVDSRELAHGTKKSLPYCVFVLIEIWGWHGCPQDWSKWWLYNWKLTHLVYLNRRGWTLLF